MEWDHGVRHCERQRVQRDVPCADDAFADAGRGSVPRTHTQTRVGGGDTHSLKEFPEETRRQEDETHQKEEEAAFATPLLGVST